MLLPWSQQVVFGLARRRGTAPHLGLFEHFGDRSCVEADAEFRVRHGAAGDCPSVGVGIAGEDQRGVESRAFERQPGGRGKNSGELAAVR